MNINAVNAISGNTPAVSPQHGGFVTGSDGGPVQFKIEVNDLKNYADDGTSVAALRPGDITINLADSAVITDQVSGDSSATPGQTFRDGSQDEGAAHIQSFSINVPMSRTVLQRLGSNYGYARVLDVPIQGSFTVNAIVSELKNANLMTALCEKGVDLDITIWDPECRTGAAEYGDSERMMVWQLKDCNLESEAISSSIGDNKTVDLTYNYQMSGPKETGKGIFLSGAATGI